MSHSFSKILLHVVFSTKKWAYLIPESRLYQLHSYIAQSVNGSKGKTYKVGGISNHVHIAMSLPKSVSIGQIMERVKTSSSI